MRHETHTRHDLREIFVRDYSRSCIYPVHTRNTARINRGGERTRERLARRIPSVFTGERGKINHDIYIYIKAKRVEKKKTSRREYILDYKKSKKKRKNIDESTSVEFQFKQRYTTEDLLCFCMQHAPMSSTVSQIERVFTAASHKKVWDHFTKAQRKNIEMWKKQSSVCMYTALPYAGSVSLFSLSPPSSLPFPSLLSLSFLIYFLFLYSISLS